MYRYLVNKSNNRLIRLVDGFYVINLGNEPYHYIIESERMVPPHEMQYWSWNGSKLSVDVQRMQREDQWKKAHPWIIQEVKNKSWDSLSAAERTFILQSSGATLTVDDINALIALWANAGSPIV